MARALGDTRPRSVGAAESAGRATRPALGRAPRSPRHDPLGRTRAHRRPGSPGRAARAGRVARFTRWTFPPGGVTSAARRVCSEGHAALAELGERRLAPAAPARLRVLVLRRLPRYRPAMFGKA